MATTKKVVKNTFNSQYHICLTTWIIQMIIQLEKKSQFVFWMIAKYILLPFLLPK